MFNSRKGVWTYSDIKEELLGSFDHGASFFLHLDLCWKRLEAVIVRKQQGLTSCQLWGDCI